MPLDLENDPTLNDALAKLEAAEAGQQAPPSETFVQADADAQQPGQTPGAEATEPKAETTDTPAEAEPKATEGSGKVDSETKPEAGGRKPEDGAGSKFARDAKRRDDSWKALNSEKEAFKRERESFQAERQKLEQERSEWQTKQAKAQTKYTPEQYEQASSRNAEQAGQLELQARGLEAQVAEFEQDGKYTEAESAKARAKDLREQAAYQRGVARQLKEHAAHVRANPDPTVEQLKARNAGQLRDYTLKAAQEWPDIAKPGSEFQKAVAANIQAAREAGLDENEFPVIRYHAAKMAALESAAARVSGLEKALGQAQAKVKELEALTAPGGGQGAVQTQQRQAPLSDDEEAAQLRAQALTM